MNIFGLTEEELIDTLTNNGFKKYNAKQVIDWIYKKKVYDFNKMTNLSKSLISFLCDNFNTNFLKIVKEEKSKSTHKFLIELEDKNKIECVLMHHGYGKSLCISSQIGCNMGCAFCESGRLKKIRNLSTSELVLQILTIENYINARIDNVVVMGIGEPFDNYDNIVKFISIVTSPRMIELGSRKITISTCGLVDKIYDFANIETQVNLAVSLHASTDVVRNKIMKVNKAYPIKEILASLDYYIKKTNRRVTIEYIMLNGVNDEAKDAKELARILKGKLMYVNLIPYNETDNTLFKRSEEYKIKEFYDILNKSGIKCTIRKSMGEGVSAACGQLRAREMKEDIC